MITQVRVDEIGQRNTIYLGVTGTPPADLTVTNFYEDVKDSVIITTTGILRKDSTVSFHGYSSARKLWFRVLVIVK